MRVNLSAQGIVELVNALSSCQSQLFAAQAETKAAREDTKRLDWLESNPDANEPIIIHHPPSDLITWRVNSDNTSTEYKTLREAIDAAVQAGKEGK
jgi:hypothetical protein